MNYFYNIFGSNKEINTIIPFKIKEVSKRSIQESANDSIYGLTTPKLLIIQDIRAKRSLSIKMLLYIKTNLTEADKYELILEYNMLLNNANIVY